MKNAFREGRILGAGWVLIGMLNVLPALHGRTFTDNTGRKIEADLVATDGASATIKMANGKEYTLPLSKFSEADQAYLREQASEPAPTTTTESPSGSLDATRINDVIGHQFFGSTTLWSDDPDEVAKRLQWPQESRTPRQSSFRRYPRADYRFLGARPYSAVLYGQEGKVTSVSIVFANKGDLFGSVGGAEAHFDKEDEIPDDAEELLEKAMENDEARIGAALSSVLGESDSQRFGEGKTRTRVERWDWEGHSFLLTALEGEYVGLQIQPTAVADAGGKTARVSDADVRARIRANVERRSNGDVVIANLPMVDQGPKGYCVPATFERCMRYLDVPADMYLLAMAGQSGLGGGTSPELLIRSIGSDVKRKGRRFDELGSRDLSVSKLSKYIDAGLPVVWSMCSTNWFNETANARTAERKQTTDWGAWAKKMEAAADAAKDREQANSNHHVVIIIGYNEETDEIAFTDSWGPRYAERWITIPEAETVTSDRLYVIQL